MAEPEPQPWHEIVETGEGRLRSHRSAKRGASPLLVAVIVFGVLALGVGGCLVIGKSWAVKSLEGHLFSVTKAIRDVDPKNGKQIVAVTIQSSPAPNANGMYFVKARTGGQTSTYEGAFRIFPGMAGTIFLHTAEHGPVEVWVETSAGPNGDATRVSNTYLIR